MYVSFLRSAQRALWRSGELMPRGRHSIIVPDCCSCGVPHDEANTNVRLLCPAAYMYNSRSLPWASPET